MAGEGDGRRVAAERAEQPGPEIDADTIDTGWVAALHRGATRTLERMGLRPQPLPSLRDRAANRGRSSREAVDAPLPRAAPWAEPAFWVVLVAVVGWAWVFGGLTVLRFERYSSFGFDLGIYDQGIWLISFLEGQFVTVRGIDLFGHHANLAFYLFAPFYRLGAGPNFINVTQVIVTGAGAIPVYLIARDRLRGTWMAAFLAGAFLLHPSLQFFMWEQFHPEVMAITPLLLAYWFSVRERWGWYAASLVLAVLFKEDVALFAAVLGIVIAFRGHRKAGLITTVVAVVWFQLVTKAIIPYFAGATFYTGFFGDLGDTPTEIAWNALAHPSLVIEPITAPDSREYLFRMLAPFGFVPLAAPGILLTAAPQTLVNLLSTLGFTREHTFHYSALPLTGLTLAMIEGVRFVSRRSVARRALVGVVFASAVAASVSWGLSPIGDLYRTGWWPLAVDEQRQAARDMAVSLVPADAAVSATYQFVPHLSHRVTIYEFPNPFRSTNWGVPGHGSYPSEETAEWLVIDRLLLDEADRNMVDAMVDDGTFTTVFDREGVLVARRRGAPGG